MATSAKVSANGEEQKKTVAPQIKRLDSQDEWISEEELYTEGSSDEDDMALQMKRHERGRAKREKSKCSSSQEIAVDSSEYQPLGEGAEANLTDEYARDSVTCEQELDDDSYMWRPTQGSFKLKHIDLEEKLEVKSADEETQAESSAPSLSEAYSHMHKLDALLRDSDRKLKEAQAETLRAQLSTRAQLQQLRERAGTHNVVLSRNWDAFMQLCPAGPPSESERGDGARGARGDQVEQGYSVLPRISGEGEDSDQDVEEDDDNPNLSSSALAITDEEKLKLADLLRDLDSEPCNLGYTLDAEARRCLADIDGKLQELTPAAAVSSTVIGRGATRQQRLDDIDRCLQALAASALGEVQPVCEDEVRRLLGEGVEGLADPALLDGLLQEARKELPHFRYRHQEPQKQAAAATAAAQLPVSR